MKEDAHLIEKVENAFSAAPSLGKWFSEKGEIRLFRAKPEGTFRRQQQRVRNF